MPQVNRPTPRRGTTLFTFAGCACLCVAALAFAQVEAPKPIPSAPDLQACRDICQALGSRLMQALQTSLKQGGPTAAISVCRDQAPKIASEISKEMACTVRRTSLKTRNPKNAPDAWERGILETFQRRVAEGEDPASLECSEVVREGGVPVLRYMRGIAVGGPCLACHGPSPAPEVSAALRTAYPEDHATGYEKGSLRGAFSVRKPLPSKP